MKMSQEVGKYGYHQKLGHQAVNCSKGLSGSNKKTCSDQAEALLVTAAELITNNEKCICRASFMYNGVLKSN